MNTPKIFPNLSVSLIHQSSETRIPLVSALLNNYAMQNVDEIRRARLRQAAEELGSVQALADAAGKSPSQISQLITGAKDSKTGKPRGMRSSTAREIEAAIGKPSGWLEMTDDDLYMARVKRLPPGKRALLDERLNALLEAEGLAGQAADPSESEI